MDAVPFKLYFVITGCDITKPRLIFYIYLILLVLFSVQFGLTAPPISACVHSSSSSKISFYHKSASLYCFMLLL